MRLLLVADNDFAEVDGKFYYGRINKVNAEQYLKYFESISYIARNQAYFEGEYPIVPETKVKLVGRYGVLGLWKAMKSMANCYDIVLVRNGFLGCFASIFAKRINKPLISYLGSDSYEFYKSKHTVKAHIIALVWRYLERKKMIKADYAHYCTSFLHEKYPCNCPYLICSNANVVVDKRALDGRLNKISRHLPNSKIIIGLMGQFMDNDNKGIPTVLNALSMLDDQFEFEVVGIGNPDRYAFMIENFNLNNRVRFLGYFSEREQINKWLDSIDIYVQPSMSEGLPRATIEAMARACPAIGSDVGDMKVLIDKDYLIKPGDFAALASKIVKLSDPTNQSAMAHYNFNIASGYSEDIRNEKLDSFYFKIIKNVKENVV